MKFNNARLKSIFLLVCLVFSAGAFSQTTISSEDFESGWIDWFDGGGDCTIRDDGRPNATEAVRIRNNSGSSHTYSKSFNLSTYNSVSITFEFEFRGMEDNESFEIEFDQYGDNNWQNLVTYTKGSPGFENNDTDYVGTFTLNSGAFDFSLGNSIFRIAMQNADQDNDRVYIDNIVILGYSSGGVSYCTPSPSSGTDHYISNVTVGTISNTTTYDVSRYSDFTSSQNTDLVLGTTNAASITRTDTAGDLNYTRVWIDFNQNGDFTDSGEEVYFSGFVNFDTNLSFNIAVPVGATPGITRMRVHSGYFAFIGDPCTSGDIGEVEDYEINLVTVSEPIIDVVGNGTMITDGQTAVSTGDDTDFGSVEFASDSVIHTFAIENNGTADLSSIVVSISGDTGDFTLDTSSTSSTVASSSSTTFTVTFDPTVLGTRTAEISIASNDTDRSPYTFNLQGEGIYCESYGDTVYDTGISSVSFNDFTNASDIPLNAYSNFTGISTDVSQGTTYSLTVKLNTDGNYSVYAMAWIDWNQDGDFSDANEEYILGFSSDIDNGQTSLSPLSVTVPVGATIGSTRMRVSAKWDGSEDNDGAVDPPSTSCETGFDGEVEDYSINVTAGVMEPEINLVGNLVNITNNDVTPSTTDDTDFGSIQVSSGLDVHTFTIENNGLTDLSSIAVSISGDTGDFTLDTSSISSTVSSGGTTTFTVTFDPIVEGIRTAVISIVNNDTDENPYSFNIEGEGSLYCPSYGTTTNDYGISLVSFNAITNASDVGNNQYSDFTGTSTDIDQGSSYNLTVNINTDTSTADHNTLGVIVWIDWNQDGDFDDANEYYNLGEVHDEDDAASTLSPLTIAVPSGATPGNTRMRVSAKRRGDHNTNDLPEQTSCETGFEGEVEDYTVNVIEVIPLVDFDGADDYIDFGDNFVLDKDDHITIEAWILQEQTVAIGTIISKGDVNSSDSGRTYGYYLTVENNYPRLHWYKKDGASIEIDITSPYAIVNGKWYHIAAVYDEDSEDAYLYVDGILVGADNDKDVPEDDRSDSFLIGASYDSDDSDGGGDDLINHFDGFIDEVRIWNEPLSQDQIQKMMNQEIEANGSNVRGKVIPRDIPGGLEWEDLIGYYSFNDDRATDQSDSTIDGIATNISTVQDKSTPLPYYTFQDGDWDETNSTTPWQYGETAWRIPNTVGIDGTTKIDWNIITSSHNVDVERELNLLGLLSESTSSVSDEEITDSELTIGSDGNDYELNVSWYLKLDGKIDLQNESQLIQGAGSWLDVDSSGYVERDQQGTANSYTYNYWSSPVGLRNITENNKEHKLGDVLRDGHQGGDVVGGLDFDPDSTSSVDPYYADGAVSDPRKAATYWMYKFVNSQVNDYTNWEWVGNYYDVSTTEGYTMKGTSGSGSIDMGVETQNYVFRGKPNNVLNGDTEIVHTSFTASFDTNGNPKISLAGNPFPSAIDADAFIDDNINSINGQIYFWEHWGGGTHKWAQYQGGYSIYTKAGGVPAVSHPDVSQVGSGSKTPERYIPIGQGFYVIQRHDVDGSNIPTVAYGGDVVFNNDQRIFKTEASGESIFTKESAKKNGTSETIKETKDKVQRIRIGFTAPDGFYRSNMIAFLEGATDNFDNGYDAIAGDFLKNDGFFINGSRYQVIQAFGEFDKEREIPITLFIDEDGQGGLQSINLEAIENFDQSLKVYIKDKHNNSETYDLSSGNFEVNLEPGEHRDRFSVVFQSRLLDLESLTKKEESVTVFMNNTKSQMHIEKIADIDITHVTLYNALGQSMNSWNNKLDGRSIQLPVSVSTGVYVISLETEVGTISRKVLIE